MTNNKALHILRGLKRYYNDECYHDGFYAYDGFDVEDNEAIDKAIKALEQADVLDKIRDEIACHIIEDDTSGNTPARLRADWAATNKAHLIDIAILDKYKRESEEV